jgi:hypothetical protein
LNEITNDVFKAIMIGYEPLVRQTIDGFDYYREQIEYVECPLDDPTVMWSSKTAVAKSSEQKCSQDLLIGRLYIDKLEKLLKKGFVENESFGDSIYDTGYARLVAYLKDAGCKFFQAPPNILTTTTTATATEPDAGSKAQVEKVKNKELDAETAISTIVDSEKRPSSTISISTSRSSSSNSGEELKGFRPQPSSANICISMLDQRLSNEVRTKTRVLNHISNCVSRSLLYGGESRLR